MPKISAAGPSIGRHRGDVPDGSFPAASEPEAPVPAAETTPDEAKAPGPEVPEAAKAAAPASVKSKPVPAPKKAGGDDG